MALPANAGPEQPDPLLAARRFADATLSSRNWEVPRQNPVLVAGLAVAYVHGVQSCDIAACVEHYAGDEQELDRHGVDVIMDERTLREPYLVPFGGPNDQKDADDCGCWSMLACLCFLRGSRPGPNERWNRAPHDRNDAYRQYRLVWQDLVSTSIQIRQCERVLRIGWDHGRRRGGRQSGRIAVHQRGAHQLHV